MLNNGNVPNCFGCSKPMAVIIEDIIQDGVVFEGSGGFGSTFDMSPNFVVVICDDCLHEACEERTRVSIVETRKTVVHKYRQVTSADY